MGLVYSSVLWCPPTSPYPTAPCDPNCEGDRFFQGALGLVTLGLWTYGMELSTAQGPRCGHKMETREEEVYGMPPVCLVEPSVWG